MKKQNNNSTAIQNQLMTALNELVNSSKEESAGLTLSIAELQRQVKEQRKIIEEQSIIINDLSSRQKTYEEELTKQAKTTKLLSETLMTYEKKEANQDEASMQRLMSFAENVETLSQEYQALHNTVKSIIEYIK